MFSRQAGDRRLRKAFCPSRAAEKGLCAKIKRQKVRHLVPLLARSLTAQPASQQLLSSSQDTGSTNKFDLIEISERDNKSALSAHSTRSAFTVHVHSLTRACAGSPVLMRNSVTSMPMRRSPAVLSRMPSVSVSMSPVFALLTLLTCCLHQLSPRQHHEPLHQPQQLHSVAADDLFGNPGYCAVLPDPFPLASMPLALAELSTLLVTNYGRDGETVHFINVSRPENAAVTPPASLFELSVA